MLLPGLEPFPYPPDAEGIRFGPLKEATIPADYVFGAILSGPVEF